MNEFQFSGLALIILVLGVLVTLFWFVWLPNRICKRFEIHEEELFFFAWLLATFFGIGLVLILVGSV